MAAFAASMLSGCMSDMFAPREDPSKFYLLAASESAPACSYAGDVSISSVILPGYLHRTQIAVLDAGGTVNISEFNRWAESPDTMFSRVFARELSKNMPKASVFLYPELPASRGGCDVRISVSECIGKLGGDLVFEARCVYSLDGVSRAVKFSRKISAGSTYASYVGALSQCVAEFSAEISKEISNHKK